MSDIRGFLEEELSALLRLKSAAVENENFEQAKFLKEQISILQERLNGFSKEEQPRNTHLLLVVINSNYSSRNRHPARGIRSELLG